MEENESKRFDINSEHPFVDEYGEFDIKKFEFPSPSLMLHNLNRPGLTDNELVIFDVFQIIRNYANDIGKSIKDAFFMTVPIPTFNLIGTKFRESFPHANAHFERMLKDRQTFNICDIDKPTKGKKENRFKHIGDCLVKCLLLWKNADTSTKKRNGTWKYRPGVSFEPLTNANKAKLNLAEEEKAKRSIEKVTIKEKMAKVEVENAKIKKANEGLTKKNDELLQELNLLKMKYGLDLDFESFRLQSNFESIQGDNLDQQSTINGGEDVNSETVVPKINEDINFGKSGEEGSVNLKRNRKPKVPFDHSPASNGRKKRKRSLKK